MVRRGVKTVPSVPELERIVKRDDEHYEFDNGKTIEARVRHITHTSIEPKTDHPKTEAEDLAKTSEGHATAMIASLEVTEDLAEWEETHKANLVGLLKADRARVVKKKKDRVAELETPTQEDTHDFPRRPEDACRT